VSNRGAPSKRRYFDLIGSSSVKTVAVRYRHVAGDRLFSFINIDDLEPPKNGFLVNFSQFLDAAHISTLNCNEMAGDSSRQPAYKIFSTKRRFQQSKSRPPRFKEAGAGGCEKRQLPS